MSRVLTVMETWLTWDQGGQGPDIQCVANFVAYDIDDTILIPTLLSPHSTSISKSIKLLW